MNQKPLPDVTPPLGLPDLMSKRDAKRYRGNLDMMEKSARLHKNMDALRNPLVQAALNQRRAICLEGE
jgi:hypothetical protein